MKLYHLSTDLNEPRVKTFVPRIPDVNNGEDRTIPRVCLSDNLIGCIQAIVGYSSLVSDRGIFRLYEIETSKLQETRIVHPETVFSKYGVVDALENREYWYLDSITMKSKDYKIVDYKWDYLTRWSVVKPEQVISIAKEVIEKHNIDIPLEIVDNNSEKTFDNIMELLQDKEFYNESDEIDDRILELPWTQYTSFYDLVIEQSR